MSHLKFMRDSLDIYEESLRQTGRTTYLAEQAMKTGATLVVHNINFMLDLQRDYSKLKMMTLEQFLNTDYHRGLRPGKFLFDSPAEFLLIKLKLQEVEKLMKGNPHDYR